MRISTRHSSGMSWDLHLAKRKFRIQRDRAKDRTSHHWCTGNRLLCQTPAHDGLLMFLEERRKPIKSDLAGRCVNVPGSASRPFDGGAVPSGALGASSQLSEPGDGRCDQTGRAGPVPPRAQAGQVVAGGVRAAGGQHSGAAVHPLRGQDAVPEKQRPHRHRPD